MEDVTLYKCKHTYEPVIEIETLVLYMDLI